MADGRSCVQAEKAVKKAAPSTQTIKRAPQKAKKQVGVVRDYRCRCKRLH